MIDDGSRVVKICCWERKSSDNNVVTLTVPSEKVTTNYVPAVAVIHGWQALSGLIGRKACVDGLVSLRFHNRAQLYCSSETARLESKRG